MHHFQLHSSWRAFGEPLQSSDTATSWNMQWTWGHAIFWNNMVEATPSANINQVLALFCSLPAALMSCTEIYPLNSIAYFSISGNLVSWHQRYNPCSWQPSYTPATLLQNCCNLHLQTTSKVSGKLPKVPSLGPVKEAVSQKTSWFFPPLKQTTQPLNLPVQMVQ